MAAAEIVDPDDKKLVRINRLAGTDHVIPPAQTLGLVSVRTCHMVVAGERMTNQYGIGLGRVEFAVGLIDQFVAVEHGTTFQMQRGIEAHALWSDDAD